MQHVDELSVGPTYQGYCSRCHAETSVPILEEKPWTWCDRCRDTVQVTQCSAPSWAVITTIGLAFFGPAILYLLAT